MTTPDQNAPNAAPGGLDGRSHEALHRTIDEQAKLAKAMVDYAADLREGWRRAALQALDRSREMMSLWP